LNKDDQITIAYFRKAMHEDAVSYSSFKELVDLIKASDFVYGADSLPIHLAYLLQKPHFILYPPNGSNLFFTPYVLENQFFSTFDSFK
jgi:ADP-heptose:LPS heptosyltransferase